MRYLVSALVLLLSSGCGTDPDAAMHSSADSLLHSRQHDVATRGTEVMPFDLERTVHVFTDTDDGGVQQVLARESTDKGQIALIRSHLQEEADRFAHGDFSDPAAIHGAEMPGLHELATGVDRIEIQYAELPAGAEIRYSTADTSLVRAIHHWFAAQRSDHGRHARME